jgi:hypothetical protein
MSDLSPLLGEQRKTCARGKISRFDPFLKLAASIAGPEGFTIG